jgi:hypothetical protein
MNKVFVSGICHVFVLLAVFVVAKRGGNQTLDLTTKWLGAQAKRTLVSSISLSNPTVNSRFHPCFSPYTRRITWTSVGG